MPRANRAPRDVRNASRSGDIRPVYSRLWMNLGM